MITEQCNENFKAAFDLFKEFAAYGHLEHLDLYKTLIICGHVAKKDHNYNCKVFAVALLRNVINNMLTGNPSEEARFLLDGTLDGLPDEIKESVWRLTKLPEEKWGDHIIHISKNELARAIKIAEIKLQLEREPDKKQLISSLVYLEGEDDEK